ncbi:MAG: hypothetical protein ACREK1_13050, partial [Longimicrobiales bacterium]
MNFSGIRHLPAWAVAAHPGTTFVRFVLPLLVVSLSACRPNPAPDPASIPGAGQDPYAAERARMV